MKIKSRFDLGERKPGIVTPPGGSRAKQAFKAECDINRIMDRYKKTGQLPDLISREPRYGDFSEVPDYLGALEVVRKAQEQFMALPAKVRSRFDNDPAKMLEFVEGADEKDLVEAGLAVSRSDTQSNSGEQGAGGSGSGPAGSPAQAGAAQGAPGGSASGAVAK